MLKKIAWSMYVFYSLFTLLILDFLIMKWCDFMRLKGETYKLMIGQDYYVFWTFYWGYFAVTNLIIFFGFKQIKNMESKKVKKTALTIQILIIIFFFYKMLYPVWQLGFVMNRAVIQKYNFSTSFIGTFPMLFLFKNLILKLQQRKK